MIDDDDNDDDYDDDDNYDYDDDNDDADADADDGDDVPLDDHHYGKMMMNDSWYNESKGWR